MRHPLSRRALIASVGVWPLAAWPQSPPRRPLIGYLSGVRLDAAAQRYNLDPFVQGLREQGYVPGQNITIEYRWAEGQLERLPALLAELLALKPDVLVTAGPRPTMLMRDLQRAGQASGVPVVAVAIDDPVASGLAASIARPGGQITGLSGAFGGILEKRLQLMKDLLPQARRFAVLANPLTNPVAGITRDLPDWERRLGVEIVLVIASEPAQFDAAFESMARQQVQAVAILADTVFWTHRARLGELCARHRLPAVVGGSGYLADVGLVSYQGDFAALNRRAGSFIDKILKGTKPGEIPFEQSSKLELVVNMKAARALGLRIPQSILVSADEVIE